PSESGPGGHLLEGTPGALPRQSRATLVQEDGRRAASVRGEHGPGPDEVRVERADPIRAQRDDPLLVTLPEESDRAEVEVEVVDIEADRLRDASASTVEHLQQRPIAQGHRRVADRGRL